jgi:predicted metal-binding protein
VISNHDPAKPRRLQKGTLVVCSSCRASREARRDSNGRSGGSLFADSLTQALIDHPCRNLLRVHEIPCFLACEHHCIAYFRRERGAGCLMGGFSPSRRDAVALLDCLARYLDDTEGEPHDVRWPEGLSDRVLSPAEQPSLSWQTTDSDCHPRVPTRDARRPV